VALTGALSWSLEPSVHMALLNVGGSFDAATGRLTFPKNSAFNAGVTLTVSGPASGAFAALTASCSFNCAVLPWKPPVLGTDFPEGAAAATGNTSTGAYVLTPNLASSLAATGPITWSVSPAALAPFFDGATGTLSFPIHTTLARITGATITATGAGGATAVDVFDIAVQAWDPPAVDPVTPAAVYYTGPGAATIPVTQSTLNAGALTWTLATSPTPNAYVTINASSGTVTVAQGAPAISNLTVTVTCTGSSGLASSRSFTLNTQPWAAPVVAAIANQNANVASAALVVKPSQTATPTGAIAWSVSPTSASYSIDAATGWLTVPQNVAVGPVTLTITATGTQSGLSAGRAFVLTTYVLTPMPYPPASLMLDFHFGVKQAMPPAAPSRSAFRRLRRPTNTIASSSRRSSVPTRTRCG
jgi:hypothetical protein